jgi:hypothetical protein
MQQPPNTNPHYPQQQWQQPPMPTRQQWNPQQSPLPPQQYQQPPQYQPPMPPPKKKSRKRLWLILAVVVIVLAVIIGVASQGQNQQSASTTKPTQPTHPTQQPTTVPTAKPTFQSIHYPPTTVADLRGLAAKGDASAINEFHSESVGLTGACPQPKREITVNSSVTGKQLAEDLLAYFYANQLDSPCGSLVLASHNQAEANDVYTAGRILLDVTDSSGTANVDPNATNLKYALTLDIGGVLSSQQECVVTY